MNTAAIAGGVVGGVGFLGIILGIAFFIRHHRRRHRTSTSVTPGNPHEKAQLHSDDIKPDRRELAGSKVSQNMLERQTVVSELPANEEVRRKDGLLEEMPSTRRRAMRWR